MKNCKKSKHCYHWKGVHNSEICFQKDKKGNSPKLPGQNKQDEKTESTENFQVCHGQYNVSFVMLQTSVVDAKNPNDSNN